MKPSFISLVVLAAIFINLNGQTCNLCAPPPPGTLNRRFLLEFQYACRQGTAFSSCQGEVHWNGYRINMMFPFDNNIHTFKKYVDVIEGENSLKFQGAGTSDSYGLTIDNVKLTREGTTQNICVNGGFCYPCLGGGWNLFNSIPGWTGDRFEVGWGRLYNYLWSSQVCELDGSKNTYLIQKWTFDSLYQQI